MIRVRVLAVLGLVLGLAACGELAGQAGALGDRRGKADDLDDLETGSGAAAIQTQVCAALAEPLRRGQGLGASLGLLRDGELVWSGGCGNIGGDPGDPVSSVNATGWPAKDLTVWPVSSVSKLVLGVVTLQVVEELARVRAATSGRSPLLELNAILDEDAGPLIRLAGESTPALRHPSKATTITLRMFLTHTSGITDDYGLTPHAVEVHRDPGRGHHHRHPATRRPGRGAGRAAGGRAARSRRGWSARRDRQLPRAPEPGPAAGQLSGRRRRDRSAGPARGRSRRADRRTCRAPSGPGVRPAAAGSEEAAGSEASGPEAAGSEAASGPEASGPEAAQLRSPGLPAGHRRRALRRVRGRLGPLHRRPGEGRGEPDLDRGHAGGLLHRAGARHRSRHDPGLALGQAGADGALESQRQAVAKLRLRSWPSVGSPDRRRVPLECIAGVESGSAARVERRGGEGDVGVSFLLGIAR